MAGIKDDIREDFEYLNKRAVKYDMALKTITSEDKPKCFQPEVKEHDLYMLTWTLGELVKIMQNILSEGE